MKITLTGEESLRMEPTSGQLTIEAPTPDIQYSPFHMLGSSLGACTLSVLLSWASNKNLGVNRFAVADHEAHDHPVASAIGEAGRRYTVVYDGHCKVCGRMVRMLTKWDRNHELEVIPSQAPGIRERFPWIPPRGYVESVQVVRTGDGKTWQGAAALEELLKTLPKGRLISWLFEIPLVRPLVDLFYRGFARNRYRFGCGEHCQM